MSGAFILTTIYKNTKQKKKIYKKTTKYNRENKTI